MLREIEFDLAHHRTIASRLNSWRETEIPGIANGLALVVLFLSAYGKITYLINVVNTETIVTSTWSRSSISRIAILLRVRVSKVTL